ncbi:hypothetical protein BXZ70DRAFT_252257 [Cristinia sonorae]|uniref:F-box domain-containing protein n=1 Tax=Cristinia sonorae TaxID=1940300 RepID=A0A8K0UWP3_9AGAR|nr:hypothetical protein BXZ70DRAFT_252257 [Cristinia sonorae]
MPSITRLNCIASRRVQLFLFFAISLFTHQFIAASVTSDMQSARVAGRNSRGASSSGVGNRAIVRRRRRKTLERLPDMPLDILFEIFGHLNPLDVLHLSRTSTALRNLLMHPSARPIWQAARESVEDLPDLPADLSEPAYAHLVFDTYCDFCLTSRVPKPMWMCRLRCCNKCLKTEFLTLDEVFATVHSGLEYPAQVIPFVERNEQLRFHWWDVDDFTQRLNAILQTGTEEDVNQFIQTSVDRINHLSATSDALENWQNNRIEARSNELETLRLRRREQVVQRISTVDHAFMADLQFMNEDEWYNLYDQWWMKQPKEITDRIWKNIKDDVLDYILTFIRPVRLSCERSQVLIDRMVIFQGSEVFLNPVVRLPPIVDLCTMPQIRAIITQPADSEVDKVLFDSLVPFVPAICDEWQQLFTQALVEQTRSNGNDARMDLNRLELATTWFIHSTCATSSRVPMRSCDIIFHVCDDLNSGSGSFNHWENDPEIDLSNALLCRFLSLPWSERVKYVRLDIATYNAVRQIAMLCGKDPDTVTAQEMDELDTRCLCYQCWSSDRPCVMNWRGVPIHKCHQSYYSSSQSWRVLSEADTEVVKAQEFVSLRGSAVWNCSYCPQPTLTTLIDLENHSCIIERNRRTLQPHDFSLNYAAAAAFTVNFVGGHRYQRPRRLGVAQ